MLGPYSTHKFTKGYVADMNDQRCVRFASLARVEREELELVLDVWLEDALRAPWATKDTMKLAGVLAHYITAPSRDILNLRAIEDLYQLSADSARRSLVLFSLFGLIDAYSTENNELRAALRLSKPQLLRVLKTKKELNALLVNDTVSTISETAESWAPPAATEAPEAVDAAVSESVIALAREEDGDTMFASPPQSQSQPPSQTDPLQRPHPPERQMQTDPSVEVLAASLGERVASRAAPARVASAAGESCLALSASDALARSLERLQKRVIAA